MTLGLIVEVGRRAMLLASLNDIDTPLDYGWRFVKDDVRFLGSTSLIMWDTANRNDPLWNYWKSDPIFYKNNSRGGGGPSAQSQPPPTSSKKSRQARASAQGGKSGAPARASTQGSRPRRKECPKGHYWSYKEKKCLKSKFR